MSNPHFGRRPQIAALLIDISGTIHVGTNPISGAVNAFQRLRELSIPFRLCSNTSKESSSSLIQRLKSMGFDFPNDTLTAVDDRLASRSQNLVWTSIGAVAQVLKDLNLKEPFFLLTDSACQEVMEKVENRKYSRNIDSRNPKYDSVVIGLAPSAFDYAHLDAAFRILKGENNSVPQASGSPQVVPLIATHKAKFIQTEDGLSLGPGPFVTALENASGVTAHVVGKPTKKFFQMVIDDFSNEIPRSSVQGGSKIAVIGDDIEADLGGGAFELGLWRILVKTGKYRAGDENRVGIVPPDEVFDSFADFVDSLPLGQGHSKQIRAFLT